MAIYTRAPPKYTSPNEIQYKSGVMRCKLFVAIYASTGANYLWRYIRVHRQNIRVLTKSSTIIQYESGVGRCKLFMAIYASTGANYLWRYIRVHRQNRRVLKKSSTIIQYESDFIHRGRIYGHRCKLSMAIYTGAPPKYASPNEIQYNNPV